MELVVTDRNTTRSFPVAWIELNTPTGNFVIQTGHAPCFFILSAGEPIIFRLRNGKQDAITVHRGVIEIQRDTATLILDAA